MPTASSTTIPTWSSGLTAACRRAFERVKAISPECGDALLYFGQRALRPDHHLHVDQRAVPGLGPHGAAAVRLRRGGLGRARRGGAAGPPAPAGRRADAPPAPPGLGGAHRRGRRACSPARWRSRSASRSCGASTASPGRTSSPRSSRSRWAARIWCGDRTPITRWSACPTTCRTTRRASRTTPASCPTCPLMAVAGIPSDIWPNNGLSDARIFFCLTTLAVSAVALYLCRADGRRKIRAVQALVILPLASLPLATGGDDIPVVAFLLARRGAGATATTLRVRCRARHRLGDEVHRLAVGRAGALRARGRNGERRPISMLAGMLVVAVPTIFPFALRGPFALIDDVVLFPLGLSAIPSTAASALPGHVLVTGFPSLSRALPLASASCWRSLLARHLNRHTPQTVAEVCTISGDRPGGAHPAGAEPAGGLPAVPGQLLGLGLPVGRTVGPARGIGRWATRPGRPRQPVGGHRRPATDAEPLTPSH